MTDSAPAQAAQLAAIDTMIGRVVLAADDHALTHLWLPGDTGAPDAPLVARARRGSRRIVEVAASELREYFAGTRRAFSVPLAPRGTPFQLAVWRALATIPYGHTITYGELARRVGRPRAFRAVGQANGANPLPIVYPCHRVVASGDRIGGYGGGLDAKRRLLELEGAPALRP